MGGWTKDGQRRATHLFEAAAWYQAVKPVCRCGHSATFDPYGLWWKFRRKMWDDDLYKARDRFWCARCKARTGMRVRPIRLELVKPSEDDIKLPMPIPKLYKLGARAEIIWSDHDIDRFVQAADELGLPHIADGVKLAALTGLRRADLVSLTWDEILPHSIKKKAAKISKGKRRFAVIPRIPELDTHLEHLRRRMRKSGVNNVLVNSRGMAWSGDGFGTTFNRVRDHAGIVHVDQETGKNAAMHIHDLRGTFCTKLLRAGLTNEEVAEIMGWAPDQVAGIRRSYVDQSAIVRAIGERIRGAV